MFIFCQIFILVLLISAIRKISGSIPHPHCGNPSCREKFLDPFPICGDPSFREKFLDPFPVLIVGIQAFGKNFWIHSPFSLCRSKLLGNILNDSNLNMFNSKWAWSSLVRTSGFSWRRGWPKIGLQYLGRKELWFEIRTCLQFIRICHPVLLNWWLIIFRFLYRSQPGDGVSVQLHSSQRPAGSQASLHTPF